MRGNFLALDHRLPPRTTAAGAERAQLCDSCHLIARESQGCARPAPARHMDVQSDNSCGLRGHFYGADRGNPPNPNRWRRLLLGQFVFGRSHACLMVSYGLLTQLLRDGKGLRRQIVLSQLAICHREQVVQVA